MRLGQPVSGCSKLTCARCGEMWGDVGRLGEGEGERVSRRTVLPKRGMRPHCLKSSKAMKRKSAVKRSHSAAMPMRRACGRHAVTQLGQSSVQRGKVHVVGSAVCVAVRRAAIFSTTLRAMA